ncbi:MAG: AAA family ATPase [Planctomycetota bacterium]
MRLPADYIPDDRPHGLNGHAHHEWDHDRVDEEIASRSFDEIDAEPIKWLWKGKIALGKLTALVSVPGMGKSMLTCDLAARVSTGSIMPDGSEGIQGDVILANAEDDPADTLRPRLDAAVADVRRVYTLDGVRPTNGKPERVFTLADVPVLARMLEQKPSVRLVILDPIGSFLTGADSHRDNEVRSLLAPLVKMAADHEVAVLLVMHRRKSMSRNADDMVLGSRAFTGVVRQVWHLNRDPNNPRQRLMLPGKSNIAGLATGMSFTIGGDENTARIFWNRESITMTADEAASAEIDHVGESKEDASALEIAMDFLRSELTGGPRKAKDIQREAREADITAGTLRRAREEVCEKPYKDGFDGGTAWFWKLTPIEQNHAEMSGRHEGAHEGAQTPPTDSACAPSGNLAHLRRNDPQNLHMKAVGETLYDEDAQGESAGDSRASMDGEGEE